MACSREAHELQSIGWKRSGKILGIFDRHDRVKLTHEQQHRAADLAEARGEVEAEDPRGPSSLRPFPGWS